MKIFNKEISKKQVKVFIGGLAVAVIGTTIIAMVMNKSEDGDFENEIEIEEITFEEIESNE